MHPYAMPWHKTNPFSIFFIWNYGVKSAPPTPPKRWAHSNGKKKRQINHPLMALLSANITLSAAARILRVNPKTVAKKWIFLGAVSKKEWKILGFRVSSMLATGHLPKMSRKKYGHRPDHRKAGMLALFKELSGFLSPTVCMSSDECSFYSGVVNRHFPLATYCQYSGKNRIWSHI